MQSRAEVASGSTKLRGPALSLRGQALEKNTAAIKHTNIHKDEEARCAVLGGLDVIDVISFCSFRFGMIAV